MKRWSVFDICKEETEDGYWVKYSEAREVELICQALSILLIRILLHVDVCEDQELKEKVEHLWEICEKDITLAKECLAKEAEELEKKNSQDSEGVKIKVE